MYITMVVDSWDEKLNIYLGLEKDSGQQILNQWLEERPR